MARKAPTARAGNYRAPVDTTGMDPEMKATLGVAKPKPAAKPGLGAALKSLFKNRKKG